MAKQAITWTTIKVKLGDLIEYDKNPVQISERDAKELSISLKKYNNVIPYVAAAPPNGTKAIPLLDGHQRKLVSLQMNNISASTLVEVRVPSRKLTEREKQELIIRLRKNTGEFDFDKLANFFDVPDLLEWGFSEKELLGAGFEFEDTTQDAEPQIDRAAELLKKWKVKTGDLWQIGEHRLICGDCTDAAVVARVMNGKLAQMVFTDPPYGVDYDGGTKVREKLEGDRTTDLYNPCCYMAAKFSDEKASLYLWHAGIKGIAAAAAAAGYEIHCEIVWNKNQAQFGALSAQYKQKHEPCYYCYKRGKTVRWFGPTNEITVWDVDRESINEFHPTQKPPELAIRAMKNNTRPDDVVADWFCGSGSTLVACENLHRRGRAIEISPAYCAVTLQRMSDAFPGIEIKRLK